MSVTQTGEHRFPDFCGKTSEQFFAFVPVAALSEIAEDHRRAIGEKTAQKQLGQRPVEFPHRFGDVFQKDHFPFRLRQPRRAAKRGERGEIAEEERTFRRFRWNV